MPVVRLPCHDSSSWEEYKQLFVLLSRLQTLETFRELISAHTRGDSSPLGEKLGHLSGLVVFLENFCSEEERETFFGKTLPFIAKAAIFLEDRVPDSGVPFLQRQERCSLVLGRKLVVSLLANAFLCSFQDEVEEEGKYPFSFRGLYSLFLKPPKTTTSSPHAAIAAKLKCILAYFRRLAEDKCSSDGTITVKRQVLPLTDLPTLASWQANLYPLCSISLDNSKGIEDAGSHTLQVDFANRSVGGSSLKEGCVQEEIRFSICPELLVSLLVVDLMDDNEAVVITGAERFSNYKGYGKSLAYAGEHVDTSDRDVFGNILTSIVAIDAVPYFKPLIADSQYSDQYLLRDLNKAFAGFLCQQDRGDISTELIALKVRSDSSSLALSESYSASSTMEPFSDRFSASSSSSSSSFSFPQPPVIHTHSAMGTSEVLSPIPEVSEPSRSLPPPPPPPPPPSATSDNSTPSKSPEPLQLSDIVSGIVKSGVEMAAGVDSKYAEDRSMDVKPTGGPVTKEEEEKMRVEELDGMLDAFASALSDSLFSGFKAQPEHSKSEPEKEREKPCEGAPTRPPLAYNPDVLAKSIISSVLSGNLAPSAPQPPPQTVGQPTSPGWEWRVHSYADHLADNIIVGAVLGSDHPSIVIHRLGESPKSSRSSSLTGQNLTPHEYTDDLVEGLMKTAISSAVVQPGSQLSAQQEGGEGEGGGGGGRREGGGERREGGGGGADGSEKLAERLVSQSIRGAVEESRKTDQKTTEKVPEKEREREKKQGQLYGRRSESPIRPLKPGMLRQLAAQGQYKRSSLSSETTDASELEQPSSFLHLAAPSSRMSYAWSVSSTRDEGSRPVSPTDLDNIALSFVHSVDEYCGLFAEMVIRSAIATITGTKEYICSMPAKPEDQTDGGGHAYITADPALQQGSRLDSFLRTLDEAEPLSGGEGEGGEGVEGMGRGYTERWHTIQKVLLRPVATGNWGCGVFGGDPQLKAMIQWAAVSAAGRPEMMYFPFKDKRVEELTKVTAHLHTHQWTVSQLVSALVEYCHLSKEERDKKSLFSHLLEK